MTKRIKLEISYDGTNYSGWQTQRDVPTIQQTLETVLRRITGEAVSVVGSGRTDAGVHAIKQVAAFTTASRLESAVFQRAMNGFLPTDIRINSVTEVPQEFHPIFHAVGKRYRYLIDDNRPSSPFTRNHCWGGHQPLNVETMRRAAQHLLGEHDFSSFETQGSPRKTPVRTVSDVRVERVARFGNLIPPLISIEVEATGFLYNMMRAICGTLVLFGVGKRREFDHPEQMRNIIDRADRAVAGPTAPPQGLYLLDVFYSEEHIQRAAMRTATPFVT